MGTEKKIGVGLILGLLVLFGVVLTLRLTTTKSRPLTALGSEAPTAQPAETATPEVPPPRHMTPPATPPVLLPATGRTSKAERQAAAEGHRWTLISDPQIQTTAQLIPVTPAPPSMMPQPAGERTAADSKAAAAVASSTSLSSAATSSTPTPPTATPSAIAVNPFASSPSPLAAAAPESKPGLLTPAVPSSVMADDSATVRNPLRGAAPRSSLGDPAVGDEASTATARRHEHAGSERYGDYRRRAYGDLSSSPAAEPRSGRPSGYESSRSTDPTVASSNDASAASPSSAAQPTYRQTTRYGYPPPDPALAPSSLGSAGYASSSFGARAASESLRRPDGTYVVQPNDSFWSISEKVYGTGGYFKALAELNREKSSRDDHLQAGTTIKVPTVPELQQNYPDLCPKANHRRPPGATVRATGLSMVSQQPGRRTYVVVEGDTLSDIAKYELGKRSRWGEIYELNREKLGDNYDYLVPGTELVLPEAESVNPANNLTTRPGSVYRR